MIRVELLPAEADALLRAVELLRNVHLASNRRERPGDLRQEEAAEEKIRAALARQREGGR